MQCKSGYAQAGQNKKRRADARLSWNCVGKLLLLSLLDQSDLEVVVVELAVLELLGHLDFLDLNIGILETGDQVVEILLFFLHVGVVEIGVAQNGSSSIVLVQRCDGIGGDPLGVASNILNGSGEEIVVAAAGEHGSTCNSNSGQTCDLQERTTRQNHGSILLII